jgi:cystathionine beta-lyase/cystathionine gamma-synthase
MSDPRRRATIAVQGVGESREPGDPLVPPIVQSSTFVGSGEGALLYTRYGNNPTQLQVARKLAALEGTEAALVLGSGMAAVAMTCLASVRPGEHIVASEDLYGATRQLFVHELPSRGVDTTLIDPSVEGAWASAMTPRTRLVYLEVPANPTLRVHDPRIPGAVAHEAGAAFAVDATFASPVNMRCAEHGADLVIHSATKYLGGHSDLIAGVVCGSDASVERVRSMMKLYGPSIDPHSAWLLDRGLRTLELRVRAQNETALALARWLEGRGGVVRVVYPGLPSHPDHGVARELLAGFGGMLAVVVEGGAQGADRFASALEVAVVAPSLGGVETLVSQPRLTSHVGLSSEERERIGIPDGFLRFSIGVEDVEDLRDDLARGLAAVLSP